MKDFIRMEPRHTGSNSGVIVFVALIALAAVGASQATAHHHSGPEPCTVTQAGAISDRGVSTDISPACP